MTFTAGPAGGKVHVDAPRACIREVRRVIDEVDTETADEHVCVSTPCKVVVTRASSEHVGSVGAVKPVVPATANQDVLPRLVHHIETVVPGTADEHVVAWVLEAERIVSVLDEVMPSTAAKGIAAAERSDQIVLCSTDHHIVALATADLILARSAADEIVAGGRADEVSIRSAAQLRSSVVLPDAVPAGTSADQIVAPSALDPIVPVKPDDDVVLGRSRDAVRTACADDRGPPAEAELYG